MSNHEESITLLANCRRLYEDVKSFKESKFERNVYDKIIKDINSLNSLLDNLLLNLGCNQNETNENKLFIANLGSIKLSLDHIKKSINPNFRINDRNKWVIMDNFFKNPSTIPLKHSQLIDDYLTILAGGLNLLEGSLSPTQNSTSQLKR